jgi:transketolase
MSHHEKEMRVVYALTLNELIERNPNVLCLEADLAKADATIPEVAGRHPRNFINCGVQEANMIGVGAGLAREGKIPFCATFSAFASRRCYDQITISVAYANNNVKIVGNSPGITQGPNGGTHMCFQDLAIMRAMPNMHVYSPADANELRAVMFHMAEHRQPTYLQLVRLKMPQLFEEGCRFDPQRAVRLAEGSDVTLVATGFMTRFARDAARELAAEGIGVDLLHYPSVKPFDGADPDRLRAAHRRGRHGGKPEHHRRAGQRRLRGPGRTPPGPGEAPGGPRPVRRGGGPGVSLQQARVRPPAHCPGLPGHGPHEQVMLSVLSIRAA